MDARLTTAAEALLRRAGFLGPKATVLVALSGGADSVALLLAMAQLRATHGLAVYAAHVEHGLRGESSLADAAFCEALCKRLSVPYTCDHAELPCDMHAPGAEAAAREARYRLLTMRAKACKADALLLAHHEDDQAETVLQHLLRGSGARGLRGMEEITRRDGVTLCRPFLGLSKQTLLEALEGEPYRTDESNLAPVCQRNRIRLDILPLLTAENPAAAHHIAQSARLLALDEACLNAQAEALLNRALTDTPPYFCLRREPLLRADAAVALRALRRFAERGLAAAGAEMEERSLSAEDSLALLGLLSAPDNTALNLPGSLHATVTRRMLHLTRMEHDAPLQDAPPLPPLPLPMGAHTLRYGSLRLRITPMAENTPCPNGKRTVALSVSLARGAVLRQPMTGDVIHPFGAAGSKPFRRWLTDQKLDPPFRKALPIVASGKQVLWAVGLGAAESTRARPEPSVLLTLRGDVPWLNTKE